MRTTTILLLVFLLSSCTETIVRSFPGQDFGPHDQLILQDSYEVQGVTDSHGILFVQNWAIDPNFEISLSPAGQIELEIVHVDFGVFSVRSEPDTEIYFKYSVSEYSNN